MSELQSALHISLEQTTVNAVASLAINALPDITRVIVLAAGAYWVIRGDWSLGSLLAFQAYLGYLYGPAQFLATANLQLQNALAALERVSALFDIVPEEDSHTGVTVERLNGQIETLMARVQELEEKMAAQQTEKMRRRGKDEETEASDR